jgi:beta-galactosidase
LKAVARNSGKVVAADELRTAGKPARIHLETKNTTLGTGWDDVAIVRATVVDENGIVVPRADDLVSFKLTGPGVIAAVDDAYVVSHDSFQSAQRHAYEGNCVAFVKATGRGKVTVSADASGLESSSVSLKCVK